MELISEFATHAAAFVVGFLLAIVLLKENTCHMCNIQPSVAVFGICEHCWEKEEGDKEC